MRDLGKASDQIDESMRAVFGAVADDHGKACKARRCRRFKNGALACDQGNAAVLLPERKRFALLDLDAQPIGIQFKNGCIRDPRIVHQARAGARRVEEQKRRVVADAGQRQDFVAADFVLARERDFGNAEAGFVGGRVAQVLQVLEDLRPVAALDGAIADACEQQHCGGRSARPLRNFEVDEPDAPTPRTAPPAWLIGARPQSERCTSFQRERLSEASPAFHRDLLSKRCAREGHASAAAVRAHDFTAAKHAVRRQPPSLRLYW